MTKIKALQQLAQRRLGDILENVEYGHGDASFYLSEMEYIWEGCFTSKYYTPNMVEHCLDYMEMCRTDLDDMGYTDSFHQEKYKKLSKKMCKDIDKMGIYANEKIKWDGIKNIVKDNKISDLMKKYIIKKELKG